MTIVAVGGFGSGSGKTALMERLVAVRPRFGAVKTSPRPAARLAADGFEWVTGTDVVAASGSDTRRYLDAGAVAAGWLRSVVPPPTAACAAVRAWAREHPGLFVEGISVAAGLRPERRVIVAAAGFREIKPGAAAILPSVDLIVVNRHAEDSTDTVSRAAGEIGRLAPDRPVLVANLADPADAGTAGVLAAITAWLPR